ncbi:LPXTG-motif cell wall-anchored protein [Nocardioides thalensis]|uniref:LPXTG-motif cell wall-anchored protein n=1 Tax=Nocardioides thalensis TaxID=1914755 RepID=A0A853C348_9ACTN|nr:LPXTG cell wall anchor domain-containing protein [Nocardioides thalensis]NYJ01601.1 LPXTG-motif cell wall-anchored protein [Nocardioides thalensis]
MLPLALSAALALAAADVPSAHADDLALSSDGRHWRNDLRQPLFDRGFRWVPGDSEVEKFYVRDDGPTDATMTVAVTTRDPADLLPDDDIEIAARVSRGEWIPLRNGADLSPLVRRDVERGEVARVDVRVDFLWESTNQSMTDLLPLDLVVTLAQRGTDPGGHLPDAGSGVSRWLVLLGAALLGSGVALVAGRRRQERADG